MADQAEQQQKHRSHTRALLEMHKQVAQLAETTDSRERKIELRKIEGDFALSWVERVRRQYGFPSSRDSDD